MPTCQRCGAHVSRDFQRVFGNEEAVHGCLQCSDRATLLDGRAAEK